MKEQGRLILKNAIQSIDKKVSLNYQKGTYEKEAENIKQEDSEKIKQTSLFLNIIINDLNTFFFNSPICKTLIGENILTPSLVSNGWQFWRTPLVNKSEAKSISEAVVRCSQMGTKGRNILEKNQPLPTEASKAHLRILASITDVYSSSLQQLSAELKDILNKSK